MIKSFIRGLTVFFLSGAWVMSAHALVFDLNCIIGGGNQGNGTCTPSPSYGTITITDNGSSVSVTVDLVNTGQKVLEVYLNFDPALDESGWASPVGILADEDQQKPGGYAKSMDLEIPGTGNLGFEPQSFDISKLLTDLDPSTFDFTDAVNDLIFAAVHIGACGPAGPATCQPGQTGENSIFVGALEAGQVPEPGTIALIGVALLALMGVMRRRAPRPVGAR